MKKIIIIFFLGITAPAWADMFSAEFEMGLYYYLDAGGTDGVYYGPAKGTAYEPWEKNIDAEVLFKGRVYLADLLFVGGATSISVEQIYIDNYSPFFQWYQAEAGIAYQGVELFYEHLCAHTSLTLGYAYQLLSGVDQHYDRIGIRYKGSIGRGK